MQIFGKFLHYYDFANAISWANCFITAIFGLIFAQKLPVMKDLFQKLHNQNISGKFFKIAVMKFTYGELYFINELKSKNIKFQ